MSIIFTIIIVISAVFFLYNKVRTWQTPESLLKRIYQSKATLALGTFIAAFGLNLLIGPRSYIDWTVGGIFLLLGIFNMFHGYKAYRHYVPQMK